MAFNRQVEVMSAATVANGATIYSRNYNGEYATGFRSIFILLAGSSSVTITEQASIDGTTFYDPVDNTGTAVGAVAAAITSSAGIFVVYAPVLSLHNRLKVVAAAASTLTLTLITSEQ